MGRPQPKFTDEEIVIINSELNEPHIKGAYKRLMVLKLKAEQKFDSKTIGSILDLHEVSVNKIINKYKKYGLSAIIDNNYKPNKRYLTDEQETEFLSKFDDDAINGKMLEVSDIIAAFEDRIGHKVSSSTVYYMLKRNKWRKVMPRSKHPKKASDEAIVAYKKNQ